MNVPCDVIAPSLVPKRSGDRLKTDRLDARNLARLHRAGELTSTRVPTNEEEEELRDLVRLREDLKDDRRRMQHRIKSFLLRHDHRCPDHRRGWSRRYRMWVTAQRFDDPNTQLTFDHLLAALNTRTVQLDDIDRQLTEAAERPPLQDAVARLRTLRGIDTLSARTIASEVCDFRRFASASSFMAFTGLVPSEHSSGLRERRGSITKAGNAHLRRVLVERHGAITSPTSPTMAEGSAGQPPQVLAYSWQAQVRLHTRFKAVAVRKNRNIAAVAVARELAGFIWGLMTNGPMPFEKDRAGAEARKKPRRHYAAKIRANSPRKIPPTP